MNRYQLSAYVAAVGVFVGTTTAPVIGPVHPDVTLLSADGVLSDSDTAIILGGTLQPTPSTEWAQAAEDLYFHPLGFDGGATDSAVCYLSGTDPCSAPLQVLTTPELVMQGQSSEQGELLLVQAIQNEISSGVVSAEHPLTVFGYSQSSAIDTMAETQLHNDGVPLHDVHFVLIGDVDTPDGAWNNLEQDLAPIFGSSLTNAALKFLGFDGVLNVPTPTDLYPTTIYELDQDPASDWVADFKAGGLLGALLHVPEQHLAYLGMTPEEIANSTTSTDGTVTYIDMSDNFNNFEAVDSALVHDLLNGGLSQSIFSTIQLFLDDDVFGLQPL